MIMTQLKKFFAPSAAPAELADDESERRRVLSEEELNDVSGGATWYGAPDWYGIPAGRIRL